MRKKKAPESKIEEVSKEIHWYISYATLSTYYTIMRILNSEPMSEKREELIDVLNSLVSHAEMLYEDLYPEQKEMMKTLAEKMIYIVKA